MQTYNENFDRYVSYGVRNAGDNNSNSNKRESIEYTKTNNNLIESMDFEETESVMWRKVNSIFHYLFDNFITLLLIVIASIAKIFSRQRIVVDKCT